jgi:hypothetical protein
VSAFGASVAAAAGVDRADFRFTRMLSVSGPGPVSFEPDSALLGHARGALADLRILAANGDTVPWRRLREPAAVARRVQLLNAGREGGAAVALLDLGPQRSVHDRIRLDIPGESFVARVTVSGSDGRGGPFTRLGTTTVYDVTGARSARSTTVVFPPTDFRYLSLRATGIATIRGAVVAATSSTRLVERPARTSVRTSGRRTTVVLDFGFPHVPATEFRVTSSTPRYDRPVAVSESDDGHRFSLRAYGRIFAVPGSTQGPLAATIGARYARLTIDNGDDPPLRGVDVRAFDVSRAVLAEGGRPPPYRLYYGAARLGTPSYDFARLPPSALGLEHVHRATLAPETANAFFRAAPDTRSFTAKHRWLVEAALALAALAVGAAGLVALRRPR